MVLIDIIDVGLRILTRKADFTIILLLSFNHTETAALLVKSHLRAIWVIQ